MKWMPFFRYYAARRSVWFTAAASVLAVISALFVPDTALRTSFIVIAVAVFAVDLGFAARDYHHSDDTTGGTGVKSLSLGVLGALREPTALLGEKGDIFWHNKAFGALCAKEHTAAYGKKISDLFGGAVSEARLQRDIDEPITFTTGDGIVYRVDLYKVPSGGKKNRAAVLHDITAFEGVKNELKGRSLLVGFIVIDNFAEAVRSVQDKQRTALAMIGSVLDKWTASVGGILKEYDKDKFIVLFEQRHYDELAAEKFDILDRIREIEIDNIAMPFTASMGIALIDGTLAEKETAARLALELALQRGGDQVVVKSEGSVEYFGGRSKSVQKTTKVRSRVIAGKLTELMRDSGNVIVMGHKFADHDSVASCVAVARMAKTLGVPVNVVVNIHDFNLKKIFQSMRGKGHEYDDLFIDRELAQEMIRSDTLLVVCDVNNPSFFELPELYESARSFAVIDHHRKTGEYINEPKISYIDPAASSVSELMCELLELSVPHGTLPKEEANLLFSGILLDTKRFTKNTGVKTFSAAVYLRAEGAEPSEAMRLFDTSIDDFKRETVFLTNVKTYREHIALSVCETEATQSDKIAASKAADRLLSVEDVRASFVLCRIDNNIHISARSDGTVNVQLITEKLGGGGHFDAAGAQIADTDMPTAVEQLKAAIDAYCET